MKTIYERSNGKVEEEENGPQLVIFHIAPETFTMVNFVEGDVRYNMDRVEISLTLDEIWILQAWLAHHVTEFMDTHENMSVGNAILSFYLFGQLKCYGGDQR